MTSTFDLRTTAIKNFRSDDETNTEQPATPDSPDFIFTIPDSVDEDDELAEPRTEVPDREFETERSEQLVLVDGLGEIPLSEAKKMLDRHVHISEEHSDFNPTDDLYTETGSSRRYRHILEADRTLCNEFCPNGSLGFITFDASSFDGGGEWASILDRHNGLVHRFGLNMIKVREIIPHDFEWVALVGGHRNYYSHIHLLLYIDGYMSESDFAPVMDYHVRNHDPATAEYHQVEDAVVTEQVADLELEPQSEWDREYGVPSRFARYLATHIPAITNSDFRDYDDRPRHIKMNATINWVSEHNPFRSSGGYPNI